MSLFITSAFSKVNSAKSIEKDYKSLKARLNDDVVLDKSLEAKLIERQGKGRFLFELCWVTVLHFWILFGD